MGVPGRGPYKTPVLGVGGAYRIVVEAHTLPYFPQVLIRAHTGSFRTKGQSRVMSFIIYKNKHVHRATSVESSESRFAIALSRKTSSTAASLLLCEDLQQLAKQQSSNRSGPHTAATLALLHEGMCTGCGESKGA